MPPSSSPTSFIPKAALTKNERPRSSSSNLLLVIAVIVLLISAAIYGGAFAYRGILRAEIDRPCTADGTGVLRCGLKASVERERQNIDQNTITQLQRLDSKLEVAERVIVDHETILPLFSLLEELTLPTISYKTFAYSTEGVTIAGTATSYEDIAVQTQVFSAEKRRIQSFIFSDLNLDGSGLVTFKLTLTPDPSVVKQIKNQTS